MAESVPAYPLSWPASRPRTPAARRRNGKFSSNGIPVSVAIAVKRLQDEIDRLGGRFAVVSSNVEVRLDGLPRSGRPEPTDPGIAVYFDLSGRPHCMPCDTYTRVAQNLAAVAEHIKATRAIERHGVASLAEMFAGFAALPAPGSTPWWQVLQVQRTASRAEVESAFRRLAGERHPDRGGSDAMMADLNRARDQARQEAR